MQSPLPCGEERLPTPWAGVWKEVPGSLLFSSWFGIGFLPGPAGTWGSLATIPVAELIARYASPWGLLVFALAVSVCGVFSSDRVVRVRGGKDPGEIVVDEVAGQSLALVGLHLVWPASGPALPLWGFVTASFVLFRLLDITKPGPIGSLEKLPGGWGVMFDDIAAGVVAGTVIAGAAVIFLS